VNVVGHKAVSRSQAWGNTAQVPNEIYLVNMQENALMAEYLISWNLIFVFLPSFPYVHIVRIDMVSGE
jgi:hypothetical protein